jgi:hypothetical protein
MLGQRFAPVVVVKQDDETFPPDAPVSPNLSHCKADESAAGYGDGACAAIKEKRRERAANIGVYSSS